MRQSRSIMLLGVTLLLSVLAACGSTTSQAGGSTTCKVDSSSFHLINAGKLTVATDPSYPPQEYIDPNTQAIVGFDVDIANELAKRLCLTPNVTKADFNTIETALTGPALGQQRYDASISAWTITDKRKQEGDFIPYFQAGESILVAKGNPKSIKAKGDLCGLTVAVETGTTEESEIDNFDSNTPDALNITGGACASNKVNLLKYTVQNDAIQQLLNGRADAAYQDSPVTDYYIGLNPNKVDRGPVTVSPSPEGIFLRKDNAALETAVTKAFNDMRSDGTYKTILDKWHLTADAYPPLS